MYKTPVSVLVVLHDGAGHALLLKRCDGGNLWQSVTGSIESGETLAETALREVAEETGICALPEDLTDCRRFSDYEIYPRWRHRYAPGTTHNREHEFTLKIARTANIVLNPREHSAYRWLPLLQAASAVFSPSNAEALRRLAQGIPPAAG